MVNPAYIPTDSLSVGSDGLPNDSNNLAPTRRTYVRPTDWYTGSFQRVPNDLGQELDKRAATKPVGVVVAALACLALILLGSAMHPGCQSERR